jgi:hypothetical protein
MLTPSIHYRDYTSWRIDSCMPIIGLRGRAAHSELFYDDVELPVDRMIMEQLCAQGCGCGNRDQSRAWLGDRYRAERHLPIGAAGRWYKRGGIDGGERSSGAKGGDFGKSETTQP